MHTGHATLEFRIDGTPRLLIIPFFATLPNLIQHSLFINFGEFASPAFYSRLPVYLYMFDMHVFYKHDVYKHIQA